MIQYPNALKTKSFSMIYLLASPQPTVLIWLWREAEWDCSIDSPLFVWIHSAFHYGNSRVLIVEHCHMSHLVYSLMRFMYLIIIYQEVVNWETFLGPKISDKVRAVIVE